MIGRLCHELCNGRKRIIKLFVSPLENQSGKIHCVVHKICEWFKELII